jgi:hypothetical protein
MRSLSRNFALGVEQKPFFAAGWRVANRLLDGLSCAFERSFSFSDAFLSTHDPFHPITSLWALQFGSKSIVIFHAQKNAYWAVIGNISLRRFVYPMSSHCHLMVANCHVPSTNE